MNKHLVTTENKGLQLENDGCIMIFDEGNKSITAMKYLINKVSPIQEDGTCEFDFDEIDEDTQCKMISYVDTCDEVIEK